MCRDQACQEKDARRSDGLTLGPSIISITKARKPRPRRLLEGFPPDTRIVVVGVTWEDYDRFSRAVREGENCRVAFDGKDIQLMFLGPFHESLRGIVDADDCLGPAIRANLRKIINKDASPSHALCGG